MDTEEDNDIKIDEILKKETDPFTDNLYEREELTKLLPQVRGYQISNKVSASDAWDKYIIARRILHDILVAYKDNTGNEIGISTEFVAIALTPDNTKEYIKKPSEKNLGKLFNSGMRPVLVGSEQYLMDRLKGLLSKKKSRYGGRGRRKSRRSGKHRRKKK